MNLDPSCVKGRCLNDCVFVGFVFFVVGSIVELDDLAVFVQGMRNPNPLRETHGDSFREGRLTVTWFTIEKQTGARVHGGAQCGEHFLVDRDSIKGGAKVIAFRRLCTD